MALALPPSPLPGMYQYMYSGNIYTIAPCASFFASSCRPQDGFGRVPIQIDRASESAKLKRRGIPSVSSLEGFF